MRRGQRPGLRAQNARPSPSRGGGRVIFGSAGGRPALVTHYRPTEPKLLGPPSSTSTAVLHHFRVHDFLGPTFVIQYRWPRNVEGEFDLTGMVVLDSGIVEPTGF